MAKTTTTRSRADKAEPEVEQVEEAAVEKPEALRKKELIERVVTASGMKKKDVKPVVEATLAVLGQALSDEEPMNLQPLGKVIINRKKELANGEVLITRIRRSSKAVDAAETPLADPTE
ncbi:HU family DNA-binding protein [Actibacterium lipolyticum]|uniref:Bacterial DNA-binding protein n=1 Tax=Actibacterium lipolyticum TaxID=1524263 RepID=A0A238KJF3_9RHOB|nr:HU family DNA-binding protein [Actibacterium lipolyticum]SMX42814.1 Bacterial DNA-binding protein [Actibacterium lipolyticum]